MRTWSFLGDFQKFSLSEDAKKVVLSCRLIKKFLCRVRKSDNFISFYVIAYFVFQKMIFLTFLSSKGMNWSRVKIVLNHSITRIVPFKIFENGTKMCVDPVLKLLRYPLSEHCTKWPRQIVDTVIRSVSVLNRENFSRWI